MIFEGELRVWFWSIVILQIFPLKSPKFAKWGILGTMDMIGLWLEIMLGKEACVIVGYKTINQIPSIRLASPSSVILNFSNTQSNS